jgi:hypothetical protein
MPVSYAKDTVGADTARRTDIKEFVLGSSELGEGNKLMVYGRAAAAVPAGACTINLTTGVIATGTGYSAEIAFAAGEYGWVHKAGPA